MVTDYYGYYLDTTDGTAAAATLATTAAVDTTAVAISTATTVTVATTAAGTSTVAAVVAAMTCCSCYCYCSCLYRLPQAQGHCEGLSLSAGARSP